MAMTPEDAMAFHMASAKVVSTIDGDALLIGGCVYEVAKVAPDGKLLVRIDDRWMLAEECGAVE